MRVTAVAFAAMIGFATHAGARVQPAIDWTVKSATDVHGKLRIVLRDGRVFMVPHGNGQCSFDGIQVAADGMTVGWVEGGYAGPVDQPLCAPEAQYVAAGPDIWRAGKVIRRFTGGGTDLAWSFYGKGDFVAYHDGPAHFDDEQGCGLYEVKTGKLLKTWEHSDNTNPPDWCQGLVY
jgi:hypothetical protein